MFSEANMPHNKNEHVNWADDSKYNNQFPQTLCFLTIVVILICKRNDNIDKCVEQFKADKSNLFNDIISEC